jgi:hypothetical protein
MKPVHVVVLNQAYRFAAAADGNLDTVKNYGACGQSDRLKARCTLTINRGAGYSDRKSSTQQRSPRNVAPGGTLLEGATHYHILNFPRLDPGTGYGRRD